MAEETDLMALWIAPTLAADATLTTEVSTHIYDTMAPQNVAPAKYVTFHLQNAEDLGIVNARRVWVRALWVVKMVGKEKTFAELTTGAARIDAVLHRGSGNVTGGKVISCRRLRPIRFQEVDAGVTYRHLGGLYEVTAQSN